ncbi:MAG: M48 family metallopeptidase [Candidatus Moranbacteria bacterium]|nr:M48 family metallopeptidase [Candidatus Moranbacteria bacterium]
MQKRQIILKNKKIDYKLCESDRARCLRITIYPSGELAATLPRNMSLKNLEKFLQQKSDWILRKMNLAKKRKPLFALPRASRKDYLAKKNEARKLVSAKVEYFSRIYGVHPAKISIRNQKSRWGSCSRKGNLNFNYRLVYLPEKYQDYIVVHELCHLKEFNHSKKFWDWVALAIPDYKKIRSEIRNL